MHNKKNIYIFAYIKYNIYESFKFFYKKGAMSV